jgi:hypothetical protein
VNIVTRYGYLWTSKKSGGSGKWTGTVNQLRSGVTIDLPGKEFVNRAIFYVSGLPSEPDLPEWKQP